MTWILEALIQDLSREQHKQIQEVFMLQKETKPKQLRSKTVVNVCLIG